MVGLVGLALGQLTVEQAETIKAETDGKGTLKFERVTRDGHLSGCELQFAGIRDWRAKRGELVKFNGALGFYYNPGKAFNVFVKVRSGCSSA